MPYSDEELTLIESDEDEFDWDEDEDGDWPTEEESGEPTIPELIDACVRLIG